MTVDNALQSRTITLFKTLSVAVCLVLLAPVFSVVVSSLIPNFSRWAFALGSVAAIFALYRPLPVPLMKTRLGSSGLLYLSLTGLLVAFSTYTESEIQGLRSDNPSEYLQYIKAHKDEEFYVAELAVLRPEEHARLVEQQAVEANRQAEELAAREKIEAEKKAALEAQRKAEREKRAVEEAAARKEREKELAAARQKQLEEKTFSYVERLSREIDGIASFDAAEYTDSQTSLGIGLAVFNALTQFYEEGRRLPLSPQQEAQRQKYKLKLIQTQRRTLPQFRNAYGPIMRKDLWEFDASARTFGDGYRTVEFVGGMFAANRNIKTFQETAGDAMRRLRFNQARYKWFKGASEYQYYKMDSLADGELVVWSENGNFRRVE